MFKRIICILLCCTIFGNIGGFVFAENTIEARNEALAVSTVKEWFLNNYQKFYIVEDAKFELIRYHKKEQSTHYTVSAFCKTQLKFDSVYDLPYVKGMYEEIEKMGLSEKESNEMLQIIDEYTKNSIDFSHDSIPLSIDIVVEIGDERTNKDSITLYYKDGMNTTLYPISVVELDEEELYKDGQDVFKELYKSNKNATNNTKGYYYYNRIDARDYALSYTGQNVTTVMTMGHHAE